MIIVHHLKNSRSHRILWLLEELGLPYELKVYQRQRSMLAPPELMQVHPLGKSPVITDGEVTLAESGAIIEYLLERHGGGRLRPALSTQEWVRYIYWMHFAEGSAMPPLLLKLIFDTIEKKAPLLVRPVAATIAKKAKGMVATPNIERNLAYMESELQSHTWFAGEAFSAADIQMSYPIEASASRGGLDRRFPKLMAFLHRIHERPAYERALERGGPVMMG